VNTLVLQPDEHDPSCADTMIGDSAFGTTNYGEFAELFIGKFTVVKDLQANFRTLLRFDLSAILGATVADAALTLTEGNGSSLTNETFSVHRLTQPNWTELGATWMSYDGTNPWGTQGGDFVATPAQSLTVTAPQSLVFGDLKALVQDAIALRGGMLNMLIKGTGAMPGNQLLAMCSASDPDPAKRPLLVVNYDFPPWCVQVADRAVWSVAIQDRGC
jgi:hypothetical protein